MPLAILALATMGSPAQAEGLGAPLPPLAVHATATAEGTLVTWLPPAAEGSSPILAYHVYRLSSDGAWEHLGATGATTLSFVDASPAGLAATYSVSAENSDGAGLQSAPAVAGHWCAPLAVSGGQVTIGWDCLGPAGNVFAAVGTDVLAPVADLQQRCTAVVLAGTPPQVGINWGCIGDELPPLDLQAAR